MLNPVATAKAKAKAKAKAAATDNIRIATQVYYALLVASDVQATLAGANVPNCTIAIDAFYLSSTVLTGLAKAAEIKYNREGVMTDDGVFTTNMSLRQQWNKTHANILVASKKSTARKKKRFASDVYFVRIGSGDGVELSTVQMSWDFFLGTLEGVDTA